MVIGARVSQAPTIHACTLPVIGSGTAHIRRLNGPAAMCHCVWNQHVRSGIEIVDCEKLNALARPDSLNGSPVQSSGYGPPPRPSASSWLIDAQDPERSISATAGATEHNTNASVRIVFVRIIFELHGGPERPALQALPCRRACGRIPLRVALLFLELRRDHERLPQILRVRR